MQKEVFEEVEKKLIHDYLYAWIIIDGRKERKSVGLVQGSPMSPVFSNVYMMDFDVYMESKYSFCRFADNINVYCNTEEEAQKAFADVNDYFETKLSLKINQKKSGVHPAITRMFLGYEFRRDKAAKAVTAIKVEKKKCEYYGIWHPSAIQKIEQDYHIISDGM